MKVYRIREGGWAEVDAALAPDLKVAPSLVLGLPTGANAAVFWQDETYIVVSEAIPGDKVCLRVESYPQLLRVLSDLSAVIGCDLATRMHTDLQAQIEEANARVLEVVQDHNERKNSGNARFLGRAND